MSLNNKKTCTKRLSAVEVDTNASNQHELNGEAGLRSIFGYSKSNFSAGFCVHGEQTSCTANITWYNAREKHATRNEYRLYFDDNPVMAQASEGDEIKIGYDANQQVFCELIKRTNRPSDNDSGE